VTATARLKAVARKARSRFERLWYVGNHVTCNLCDYSSRSWLHGRVAGRCPGCRCATRTRVLWWYLSKNVQVADRKLLHFAPEVPLERKIRGTRVLNYVTADFRNPEVDVQVDIQALPFADGEFDLILCSHVLEHIRDDKLAMRELRRVCSPNGSVLIMVPLSSSTQTREDLSELPPKVRKDRFGETDHLREYGRDVIDMLQRSGFRVVSFEPTTEIPASIRARHGLGDNQTIFVCSP